EIWRCINVAHAERPQVRHDLARLREGELPVKLQTVRAGRNSWVLGCHASIYRHSERSRGCNAVDEVREARLSIPQRYVKCAARIILVPFAPLRMTQSPGYIFSGASIPSNSSPFFNTRPLNPHNASRDVRIGPSAFRTGQVS